MKASLLFFALCCFFCVTGFAQQPLTATFTDVMKIDNTLYLKFVDTQKKEWLFNAVKSETAPYVFYSTDHSGNTTVNPAIRNRHFSIQYNKVVSRGRKENWILAIKEILQLVNQ